MTPSINATRLSELLQRPINTLKKQLKKLIKDDHIIRIGSKKTGGYVINK